MGKRTNKSQFTTTLVESTGTAACTSNAATLNTEAGVITTEALTTAALATQALTITNSKVTTGSIVIANLQNWTGGTVGTNGFPLVTVDAVANGSFVINLTNAAPVNAFAGTFQIAFQVLAPIA